MSQIIPSASSKLRLACKSQWKAPVCLYHAPALPSVPATGIRTTMMAIGATASNSTSASTPATTIARRFFSVHARLQSKSAGASLKRGGSPGSKKQPSRPSMASAQTQALKQMRKEDIPDDDTLLKSTYVLPVDPKIYANPSLFLRQYRAWFQQWYKEWAQCLISKWRFYSAIPQDARPKNSKIRLSLFQLKGIVRNLHEQSYKAIATSSLTGDMSPLRELCCQSLQEKYARIAAKKKAERRVIKWDARYPSFGSVQILSRKFGQMPMQIEGLPVGLQQIVARVSSQQTLTTGVVLPGGRGEREIDWHSDNASTKDMVENIVIMRRLIAGEWSEWKVFGFVKADGTEEALQQYHEKQLEMPNVPKRSGQTKQRLTATS